MNCKKIVLILFVFSKLHLKADELPDIFQVGSTVKFVFKADGTNMTHILISEVKGKWIGASVGNSTAWYNTEMILAAVKTTEPAPSPDKRKMIQIPAPANGKEAQALQTNSPPVQTNSPPVIRSRVQTPKDSATNQATEVPIESDKREKR